MVPLAFSVQGEVEKYGAYVGIAAFIGLAILSLLYFSQAREVKRLREWAGRAPERAAEIEAQAVANAEAARREREAAAATPAPEPAPVAAGATNGAPARELRPEEIAAAAFARAAGVAAPSVGGLAPPEPPTEIAVQRAGAAPEAGAEAASVLAEPTAAATETVPAGPSGPDAPTADSPDPPSAPEAPAPAPNGHHDEVPPIPPAATPAARRGAAPPRPAAPPPRRPAPAATAARRRPATMGAPVRSARSGWTIVVIVGVSLLVLAAAAFAATQLLSSNGGGGSNKSAASPTATPSAGKTATSTPAAATTLTPAQTKVVVLNSTPIPGLAASTRDQLAGNGYTKGNLSTGNFTGPPRQQSVVMYARRAVRRGAAAVARTLSIASVQPADSATEAQAQSKGAAADVIVLVGGDKSR